MTEFTRNNQFLTIYSLEFIENQQNIFKIIPEYLPFDNILDAIDDKNDFFNY